MNRGPRYQQALKALEAAHDACFNHPDRGVLGMSHGPFSGVNEALGIIALMEEENTYLHDRLQKLESMIDTAVEDMPLDRRKRVFDRLALLFMAPQDREKMK
jgi:hypothetical protein